MVDEGSLASERFTPTGSTRGFDGRIRSFSRVPTLHSARHPVLFRNDFNFINKYTKSYLRQNSWKIARANGSLNERCRCPLCFGECSVDSIRFGWDSGHFWELFKIWNIFQRKILLRFGKKMIKHSQENDGAETAGWGHSIRVQRWSVRPRNLSRATFQFLLDDLGWMGSAQLSCFDWAWTRKWGSVCRSVGSSNPIIQKDAPRAIHALPASIPQQNHTKMRI